MLGVEQGQALGGMGGGDAVFDQAQILVAVDGQRRVHMEIPGLAHKTDRPGAGLDQGRQAGIIGRAAPRAPGHAEGGQDRLPQHRRLGKKAVVGGIGAGPTALNEIDPESVQIARNRPLFIGGKTDVLGLRTIAQGGIVKSDALAGHVSTPIGKGRYNDQSRARAQ